MPDRIILRLQIPVTLPAHTAAAGGGWRGPWFEEFEEFRQAEWKGVLVEQCSRRGGQRTVHFSWKNLRDSYY